MTSLDLLKETVRLLNSKPEIMKEVLAMNKVFQFKVSDGKPFYIEAVGNELKVEEGSKQPVAATLSASDQLLTDIFSGKIDGAQAFMQGRLKISGDIFSVQKLSTSFLKARQ